LWLHVKKAYFRIEALEVQWHEPKKHALHTLHSLEQRINSLLHGQTNARIAHRDRRHFCRH
jgi:hypothetical protein